MPLNPGTSKAVQIDPTATYSTTKPGVASQTLNPFVGIEAGKVQTSTTGQGVSDKNATSLPVTISE